MDLKQAKVKFKDLKERLDAYDYALALANWDLATLAPKKGKPDAAKAIGILSGESFQLKVSKEMQEILDVFHEHSDELSEVNKRETEVLTEDMERLNKIPKDEYQEYMELQSVSQFVWEEAKRSSDFEKFAPYLEKLVNFRIRFADLTKPECHPYDACLDEFEKGMTISELDSFFEDVRKVSVPLIHNIADKGKQVKDDFLYFNYPLNVQKEISLKLLEYMRYDMDAGVLAESEHPFTTEINQSDVRLTTHYYENHLTSSIYTTVHEGGHGLYEQHAKSSKLLAGSMLCSGVSMGIHESQSRFYENIICRSYSFWEYFYPILQSMCKEQLGNVSLDELYRSVNTVKAGPIRLEADELTYNLHIMIRYELEKQLIGGSIQVSELPKLWNEKYEEYFGVTPKNNAEGVLQDVHWSGGMFGYFPSYALGNAYGAQFYHTMKKTVDVDNLLRKGDIKPINDWLQDNIHQYGMLKKPGQLIMDITGEKLNPSYLTDYLKKKFESIYF